MRNYIQQFTLRVNWAYDFNPPDPPIPAFADLMEGTLLDLADDQAQFIAFLQANPQVVDIQSELPRPVYWLLDKANMNLILAFAAGTTLGLLHDGNPPPWVYNGPNDNPRAGWKDELGVERKAPPSEKPAKGKKGKVTLPKPIINQLLVVYSFLVANALATNNADLKNAADKVLAIITDLAQKKISEEAAVLAVNAIVAKFM